MPTFKRSQKADAVRKLIADYVDYYQKARGVTPTYVTLYTHQLKALGAKHGDRYKGIELIEKPTGPGTQPKLYADRG